MKLTIIRGPMTGGADGAPIAAELGENPIAGSLENGETGTRGAERAGAAEPESPLPRPRRRRDESRGLASRVPCGDAALHGRQWYRVNRALQARERPLSGGCGRLPVSARHAARPS
jgi:hypothetical protein